MTSFNGHLIIANSCTTIRFHFLDWKQWHLSVCDMLWHLHWPLDIASGLLSCYRSLLSCLLFISVCVEQLKLVTVPCLWCRYVTCATKFGNLILCWYDAPSAWRGWVRMLVFNNRAVSMFVLVEAETYKKFVMNFGSGSDVNILTPSYFFWIPLMCSLLVLQLYAILARLPQL